MNSLLNLTPQGLAANAITMIIGFVFVLIALICFVNGAWKAGLILAAIGGCILYLRYSISESTKIFPLSAKKNAATTVAASLNLFN